MNMQLVRKFLASEKFRNFNIELNITNQSSAIRNNNKVVFSFYMRTALMNHMEHHTRVSTTVQLILVLQFLLLALNWFGILNTHLDYR